MTTNKHLKRRVRSRAAQTGEPYATARRKIRQTEEPRMTPAATPTYAAIVACSFCGKPSTAVRKIVAGPGVYICNECVELSAALVGPDGGAGPDEPSGSRTRDHDRSADAILPMLPALVRTADRIEAELKRWVTRLREQGTDWTTIANATGMSVEAAHQRFEAAGPH